MPAINVAVYPTWSICQMLCGYRGRVGVITKTPDGLYRCSIPTLAPGQPHDLMHCTTYGDAKLAIEFMLRRICGEKHMPITVKATKTKTIPSRFNGNL